MSPEASHEQPPRGAEPSRPFPGGVASASEEVAVSSFGGRLVMIDLRSGQTLAEIPRASRPLAVSRRRVAAWEPVGESRAAMRVVVYDPVAAHVPLLVSKPVVFPGWVDGTALSFDELRVAMSDDELALEWRARGRLEGGAPPTKERAQQLARAAHGTVRVDFQTGAVEAHYEPHVAEEPDAGPAGRSLDYEFGMSWSDQPWMEAGQHISLEEESSPQGRSIVLRKTHSMRTERIPLRAGRAPKALVTGDRRHILVRDESLPEEPWQLFRADSGKKVAALPCERATRDVSIIEGALYYIVDLARSGGTSVLKARSLSTGDLLWEKPLAHAAESKSPDPLPPAIPPAF